MLITETLQINKGVSDVVTEYPAACGFSLQIPFVRQSGMGWNDTADAEIFPLPYVSRFIQLGIKANDDRTLNLL